VGQWLLVVAAGVEQGIGQDGEVLEGLLLLDALWTPTDGPVVANPPLCRPAAELSLSPESDSLAFRLLSAHREPLR
jgi:hypothetical protein